MRFSVAVGLSYREAGWGRLRCNTWNVLPHPQPFEVLEKFKQIKHPNIWLWILKQNDHHLTKNKKQQHLYYCIVLLKQIIIIFISNTDFSTYLLPIRNLLSEHIIHFLFFYNPKWEWEFFSNYGFPYEKLRSYKKSVIRDL